MDKFTASNGITITTDGTSVQLTDEQGRNMLTDMDWLGAMSMSALREFVQAERDEELGRWRPEGRRDVWVLADSDDPNRVLVVSDKLSTFATWRRDGVHQTSDNGGWAGAIARAYFEAHPEPEPEPRPWEDAKPGEVWVLTYDGTEGVFIHAGHSGGAWYGQGDMRVCLDHPISDPNVTAARRIWPEES